MRLGPSALARAVVVYRCAKWKSSEPKLHMYMEPAGEVVTFSDDFRVMDFKTEVTCPDCLTDSHVVGIEWEPPE